MRIISLQESGSALSVQIAAVNDRLARAEEELFGKDSGRQKAAKSKLFRGTAVRWFTTENV